MRSAFNIEIARSIKGSFGRFIAIMGIVALGTGFYAGLRMTAPDMDWVADQYYDQTQLEDIRVVSTLGLTQADIDALAAVEGVAAVASEYEVDALGDIDGEQYTFRVQSLPAGAADGTALNQPELAEGDWPAKPGECVISADVVMTEPVAVGDTIQLTEGSQNLGDVLKTTEYTITGFVHSPYYVATTALGTTTLGSGAIDQYMYVPASDFATDYPYTEAFLLVDGAADEMAGSDAYQARVDEVAARIKAIAPAREKARVDEVRADAQAELDEARAEYEEERADAEAQLEDAAAQLANAQAQIYSSQNKIASGQAEYDSGAAELEQQRAQAEQRFAAAQDQIDSQAEQLEQAHAAGLIDDAIYEAGMAQVAAGRQQLEAQRAAAQQQFDAAQAQLDSAAAELASGRAQLAQGEAEYASGQAEYAENRAKADEEFARAEKKLADAQKEIDDLDSLKSEWLVMDRTKNEGVVSFSSDAKRVDSIAAFFPFIFFIVAALVALTTMTRMVEDERMLIGTFKALGYSRARIMSKYLIYALLASGIGSAVGIIVLSFTLPSVIMEAYAIIYYVPSDVLLPLNAPIALMSAGLGVGITLLATWGAIINTLRETPANLMLPRAPKAGKRILLERVRPIWSRLAFSHKVTMRNIFLYKKRLLMTLIGIAGCTALLLTGLGLQDSINDIIDKQYGATVRYNVVVSFDDEIAASAAADEMSELTESDAAAYEEGMKAVSPSGEDYSFTLVVPESPEAFEKLWVMRERVGGASIPLDGESVVLNEKLAYMLGAKVGDTVSIAEQDSMGNATNQRYDVTVTGIMENYVANYIFMGAGMYERTFGDAPEYSVYFAQVGEGEEAHEAFSAAVHGLVGVKTVSFNDETIDTYRTMLKSVNMIVVVLVVAAAALAFIVLYNLTNININERKREIATLKVLGFTRREVDMYIYREIIMLTVFGCLVGLVLGVFMESFVVVTAEVDYVMFGRDIHVLSFVIAFLLTMVFAIIVLLCMKPKLNRVDMVESLKSNE